MAQGRKRIAPRRTEAGSRQSAHEGHSGDRRRDPPRPGSNGEGGSLNAWLSVARERIGEFETGAPDVR